MIPSAPVVPVTTAASSITGLTQVALVLMLVVGLIAAIAWALRRFGVVRQATGSTIRIVSGLTLSNRERILVLEIADQWIVVGVAPGGMNTLATLPRQDNLPPSGLEQTLPPGKSFAYWLKQTIDKRTRSIHPGTTFKDIRTMKADAAGSLHDTDKPHGH